MHRGNTYRGYTRGLYTGCYIRGVANEAFSDKKFGTEMFRDEKSAVKSFGDEKFW